MKISTKQVALIALLVAIPAILAMQEDKTRSGLEEMHDQYQVDHVTQRGNAILNHARERLASGMEKKEQMTVIAECLEKIADLVLPIYHEAHEANAIPKTLHTACLKLLSGDVTSGALYLYTEWEKKNKAVMQGTSTSVARLQNAVSRIKRIIQNFESLPEVE